MHTPGTHFPPIIVVFQLKYIECMLPLLQWNSGMILFRWNCCILNTKCWTYIFTFKVWCHTIRFEFDSSYEIISIYYIKKEQEKCKLRFYTNKSWIFCFGTMEESEESEICCLADTCVWVRKDKKYGTENKMSNTKL